jgi:hypothetical protein
VLITKLKRTDEEQAAIDKVMNCCQACALLVALEKLVQKAIIEL